MKRLSPDPYFLSHLCWFFVKICDVSARKRLTLSIGICENIFDSLTISPRQWENENDEESSDTFGCRRKFGCHLSPVFLYFPLFSPVSLKQWTRAVQRLKAAETAENGKFSYNNLLLKKYISSVYIIDYSGYI